MSSSRPLAPGDPVRFSERGRRRTAAMPEAWGLHRAATFHEVGEVLEVYPAEEDFPQSVAVEFPSGSAYNWPADCFERVAGSRPIGGFPEQERG